MNQAQAHRGPNDSGVFFDPQHRVGLAHRRLSILDLSAAGQQPMQSADANLRITYNGEVYNYLELRQELEGLGRRFRTATDTEVVLEAYAHWGADCVRRLRGMFAFAIYDQSQPDPVLFLARDRFGVKPLYYAQVEDSFVFASELKGILASGLVARKANRQAVWDYLSYGSVPQPHTILEQVRCLPAAHTMTVSIGTEAAPRLQRYWDLALDSAAHFPEAEKLSDQEALLRQRHLLDEATRLHLIADVPVGCFLSGGIDSTAVAGLMSKVVNHPIKTFSIGFESKYEHLSELAWARLAADCLGSSHQEVILTGAQVASDFDRLVQAIDQPSLDGTNSYFVSRAAAEHVTVALSGVGGDELFAGYPHFRQFAQAERWKWVPRPLMNLVCKLLPSRLLPNKHFLRATPVQRFEGLRALGSKGQLVSPAFLSGFSPAPPAFMAFVQQNLSILKQVSYFDCNAYMANTLLRDMDAMSMASSLEVRPPLLDHVVAEFAFALSDRLKLNPGAPKYAFTQCLSDLLPPQIVKRPKMGFEMPLCDWLAGPLRERALESLSSEPARAIFSGGFLQESRQGLAAGNRPKVRLWAYFVLLEWLRRYQVAL